HEVSLVVKHGVGAGECPQRCNGHGHCFLGRCQCQQGYNGPDCSEVVCPVLCSGRGDYVGGQCRCFAGYKGRECELSQQECQVAHCNNNGHCIDGVCHCSPGYTGEFCDKVDCPNPTCSG
ncbi:EGF-like domain extracellular, partial [Trinorchestia longiramus]